MIKIDRLIDLSYNADLQNIVTAINKLIDIVEALQKSQESKPRRTVKVP